MRSPLTLAAIRSGTDPLAPLPGAAFHRWLEDTLDCPRCNVTYNVVVPWDEAVGRFFEQDARGPLRMLRKAIQMGHASGHKATHLETSGVIIKSYAPESPSPGSPKE